MENLNKIREWSVSELGDVFMFGMKGAGKTCKLLAIAQALYDKGMAKKVWDLFGGDRDEGLFWCFPNRDYNLWEQVEDETYDLEEAGPKQYKVRILFPLFSEKIPKKLPTDNKNVQIKPFTIPIQKITDDHIATFMGKVGKQASTLWQNLQEEVGENGNGADIEYMMNKKHYKLKKSSFYNQFIKPLTQNHFLSNSNSELNLDLIEESKDTDRVTILSLGHIPQKYHMFILSYILRELYWLLINNKIHKKHFALFREASRFMKVVDEDKSKAEPTNAFRNFITDFVRYGRIGLSFGMDTQDSSEVKNLIDGQQSVLGINEMPSVASIETTCKPLKSAKRMTKPQIDYIQWRIKKHQVCLVERGKRAVILKRINPPRTMYWKPEYGSFWSLWNREVGKWEDSKIFIDKIKSEYQKRKDYLEVMNYEGSEDNYEENNKDDEEDDEEDNKEDEEVEEENNNNSLEKEEKEEENNLSEEDKYTEINNEEEEEDESKQEDKLPDFVFG